jgi:hypothetical protein
MQESMVFLLSLDKNPYFLYKDRADYTAAQRSVKKTEEVRPLQEVRVQKSQKP